MYTWGWSNRVFGVRDVTAYLDAVSSKKNLIVAWEVTNSASDVSWGYGSAGIGDGKL